jgi:cysteine desulfurase
MEKTSENLRRLRDSFENEIGERIDDLVFNRESTERLPNISNISFRAVVGEVLLINLDMQDVAVSTGSVCSSVSLDHHPSLGGRDDELVRGAIRFSFGKENSAEDIDCLPEVLRRPVENLRRLTPARAAKQ